MAAGDEKQDEIEQLLARRDNSAAPKAPGNFTRFFGVETVQPRTPGPIPGMEAESFGSYPPSPSAPVNLNADAPSRQSGAVAERAHPDRQAGMPPVHPESWQDATVRPLDQFNRQPDSFSRFFHNETEFGQPSASGFSQTLGSPGLGSSPASDPLAAASPKSASEYLVRPNDGIETGPPFVEPHPVRDSQKATHLFSQPRPIAEPAAPLAGPSPYTRVINSSAQRADEEKAGFGVPPAGNASPPVPAPVSIPAPFAAPQWPPASAPGPQVYPLPYLQQPPAPMPAVSPVSWPQAPAPPAVAAPSAPQPQVQYGEQTPQSGWIAYMPLIIGLNVLLLLTAIFILIFALSK